LGGLCEGCVTSHRHAGSLSVCRSLRLLTYARLPLMSGLRWSMSRLRNCSTGWGCRRWREMSVPAHVCTATVRRWSESQRGYAASGTLRARFARKRRPRDRPYRAGPRRAPMAVGPGRASFAGYAVVPFIDSSQRSRNREAVGASCCSGMTTKAVRDARNRALKHLGGARTRRSGGTRSLTVERNSPSAKEPDATGPPRTRCRRGPMLRCARRA
jgi:hypothetical protein